MKRNTSHSIRKSSLYDYSGSIERQETIAFLLDFASKSKTGIEEYWKKMKRYYDGDHDIRGTYSRFAAEQSLPWLPAQSTDGYVHVESQINATVPDFEFSPREKNDTDKAKQREKIVKYICDNANLAYKNARNERLLGIYGSSVWKVCWDSAAAYGENNGDVAVLCPSPDEIYTDPTSTDVDGCEYIGYVYRMHKQKAMRIFAEDFRSTNSCFEDYLDDNGFFSSHSNVTSDTYDAENDTVSITEWWFRQPRNGRMNIKRAGREYVYEWKAGDIALSVLINGKEVRYIPKYWKRTGFTEYPFVISSRIPDGKSIWGKSELSQIIPLIDAKDRELGYAQLNGAFNSNDIILLEENALCDGENLDNSPGAVWKLRPGMIGKVARLGNMSPSQTSLYSGAMYWQNLIEITTGNFEINQGKEPSNVTTATGIALLNERSESRKNQKSIDRNEGFKRLFSLIDKTALENYSDGRVVRLGFCDDDEFVYNFGGFIKRTRLYSYIPSVDITIHTGAGITNSRAFTVSALTSLIGMNINADNYKLVKAYVQNLGIPEREEICRTLDEKFEEKEDAEIKAEEILKAIGMLSGKEEENDRESE